ncbi:hypothetical protein ES703_112528 [subsurface metagenome]
MEYLSYMDILINMTVKLELILNSGMNLKINLLKEIVKNSLKEE